LHLDAWEQLVLIGGCGERSDGKWAAFEVGVEAPRQNGKGSILEARELAGLFSFGERLLIHSAHEQATSSEHFRRLLGLIESVPDFDRRVIRAPKGKGAEAIELRGGQRILFKTRTGGGGRGLTGDFVALDEAMILPEAMIAALVPTMAARSIHGNPQLWYAGSAVDRQKHEHGVVFARVRERGLRAAPRVAWFEWSVDGDDPDELPAEIREDPAAWAQANPGMGIRISAEHIANECAGALGPREFAVERLGIGDWPPTDGTADQVISDAAWTGCLDQAHESPAPQALALDVKPDRSAAAIGAADESGHVKVLDHRPGTGWLVERAVELDERYNAPLLVDERSPAASFIDALTNAGVKVIGVNGSEYAMACGTFFDAVVDRTMSHEGSPELNAAVKGASKRPLGDAWAWSRKTSGVDISPLVACTLAHWALQSGAGNVVDDALVVISLD
jgi:hypothetical protein